MSIHNRLNQFERIPLGDFPSPVREICLNGSYSICVKDDGVCSSIYGGNKIRKLEYLLADAKRKKKSRLVVHGDTGSHNVIACSLYGRHCGFEVDAIVFSHYEDNYTRQAQRKLADIGVAITPTKNMLLAVAYAHLLALREDSYLVPLGSSTPLTTLGYIQAAIELCHQVDEGEMPLPEKIFIAHATGGSVAGLLIGLAMMKSSIKVVAVQTVENVIAGYGPLARLIRRTLRLLGASSDLFEQSMARLQGIDSRFMGKGYRDIPNASLMAVQLMRDKGLSLEPVFTGKAMAALLAEANSHPSSRLVFWNTHDQLPQHDSAKKAVLARNK